MDVALILSNPDVIDLVTLVLQHRNLRAGGLEPSHDIAPIEELIVTSNPSVVVFDLSPPYKNSTAVVRALLNRFPDRAFVFTCADPVLAIRAARWLSWHPVLQKPYDPDEIVGIVSSLVRRNRRIVEEIIVTKTAVSSDTVIVS